ncbi:class I mannose-6-phosphate isomerase [Shumkonia mesophila]|uniref:class I mannose-6-phosphate isomerase n=1 Tax=Shumkonia mesophila TaxID=2838854 RepID=UPI002934559E|nr:hypothetical protein [Shumkonia mesophila]
MPLSVYRRPFRLLPNRVWRTYQGGAFLDRIEGKPEPRDGNQPEDWIGSAVAALNPARPGPAIPGEGLSIAEACDGCRLPMTAVLADDPEAALGAAHVAAFGVRPQLLVKFIDSAVRLSIQAHPSVAWAKANLGAASGKTEAWWILETRRPDAWVLAGFQRPPGRDAWRRMIAEQDSDAMMACFDPVRVAPGNILLIEGGLPHAIGPGLTLLEIQEPTDFVVQCEYADKTLKVSESARTLGLGAEKVVDMFDFTAYTPAEVKTRFGAHPAPIAETEGGREQALLAAPRTRLLEVRRLSVTGAFAPAFDGRYSILVVLDGEGTITVEGEAIPLKPWTRLFLPAAIEEALLTGRMTLARCLPPKPPGA